MSAGVQVFIHETHTQDGASYDRSIDKQMTTLQHLGAIIGATLLHMRAELSRAAAVVLALLYCWASR